MKTFIITLLLTIGMAGFVTGQTAEKNRPEKGKFKSWFHKDQTPKPRTQMKHFESVKADKEKVKHNGTLAYREIHKRNKHVNVDGNGFSIAKASYSKGKSPLSKSNHKKRKLHKKKNKNFDTYVMK